MAVENRGVDSSEIAVAAVTSLTKNLKAGILKVFRAET